MGWGEMCPETPLGPPFCSLGSRLRGWGKGSSKRLGTALEAARSRSPPGPTCGNPRPRTSRLAEFGNRDGEMPGEATGGRRLHPQLDSGTKIGGAKGVLQAEVREITGGAALVPVLQVCSRCAPGVLQVCSRARLGHAPQS